MQGSLKFFWLKHRIELWVKVICLIILSSVSLVFIQYIQNPNACFFKEKETESFLEDLDQTLFSLNPQFLNPEFPKILESFYAFCAASLVYGTNNIHLVDQNSDAIIQLDYQEFVQLSQFIPKLNEENDWAVKPLKVDQNFLLAEAKNGLGPLQLIKIPMVDFSVFDQAKYEMFLNHLALKEIKSSKYVGEDLLIKSSTDVEKNEFYRLKIGSKIQIFEKNKRFFFKKGIWDQSSDGAELVLNFDEVGQDLYANIADGQGRFQQRYLIEKQPKENLDLSNLMPKSTHYLSKSSFFCLLGLQKMTLQEGDWILKEKNFFRLLKSKNEIEQLLSFKKQGLLLIIDSVKESKNQLDIKVKIFSPLRTQMQESSLQILVPKPTTVKSKKRAVKQK